ncbi:MAG: hypothetical protein HUJ70_03280 [Pseudobutyrivibrio sp.]|nr:hypothetical protein [Pseudobutyrivibrio sp.]
MKDIRKSISERLKLNNEGSSIITVLVIMALCIILISVVLSASLLNFQMKMHSRESNANFYDAETSLEMIRMGLVEDASKAAATAYLATMERYDLLTTTERADYFESIYASELVKKLKEGTNGSYYALAYLKGFLGDTAYTEAKGHGAVVTTPDVSPGKLNFLNVTNDGVVLKNVRVRFTDPEAYTNEIQTDIVLGYPAMNFALGGNIPDLARFAFVANERTEFKTHTDISGSAYIGKSNPKDDKASEILTSINVKFDNKINNVQEEAGVTGDIIGDGLLNINKGNLTFDKINVWLNDLQVDSGTLAMNNCNTVMDDDLVLAASVATDVTKPLERKGASATLTGEYYGVGDGTTAEESSSIVINGINTELNLSGLNKMMIGGVAYVDTSEYNLEEGNKDDVMMGESIALKPNQRAYLVPPSMVGTESVTNGGMNPMLSTRYKALVNELKAKYGDGYRAHMVDWSGLNAYGVTGFQEVSYQVVREGMSGTLEMTYLFLVFDSPEDASAYYNSYMANGTNQQRLANNILLYSESPGSIKLPDNVLTAENMDFYYNGTILKSDDSSLYLPRKALSEEASKTLTDLQNKYKALNCKLIKDYGSLSQTELEQDVYTNLVKDMVKDFSDHKYVITGTNQKSFVSTTGSGAALVKNMANGDGTYGTFILDNNAISKADTFKDKEGSTHANAKLNVLIVNGNVKVTATEFEGLIVCSGELTFENTGGTATIKANPIDVLTALAAEDDKGIRALDYLKNSESYLIGGISNTDEDDPSAVSMTNLVYYANWSKR